MTTARLSRKSRALRVAILFLVAARAPGFMAPAPLPTRLTHRCFLVAQGVALGAGHNLPGLMMAGLFRVAAIALARKLRLTRVLSL
eukprot:COSAG06_NODE_1653_length_8795_cov_6.419273_2_plen_86_part_00